MQSTRYWLLECDSIHVHGKISRRDRDRMLRRGLIEPDQTGNYRVIAPNRDTEHPCRTRISSGGPLAAMGMSQIYTLKNERGDVSGFKSIYPEDRPLFNLATMPGFDLLVACAVVFGQALSQLIEFT